MHMLNKNNLVPVKFKTIIFISLLFLFVLFILWTFRYLDQLMIIPEHVEELKSPVVEDKIHSLQNTSTSTSSNPQDLYKQVYAALERNKPIGAPSIPEDRIIKLLYLCTKGKINEVSTPKADFMLFLEMCKSAGMSQQQTDELLLWCKRFCVLEDRKAELDALDERLKEQYERDQRAQQVQQAQQQASGYRLFKSPTEMFKPRELLESDRMLEHKDDFDKAIVPYKKN